MQTEKLKNFPNVTKWTTLRAGKWIHISWHWCLFISNNASKQVIYFQKSFSNICSVLYRIRIQGYTEDMFYRERYYTGDKSMVERLQSTFYYHNWKYKLKIIYIILVSKYVFTLSKPCLTQQNKGIRLINLFWRSHVVNSWL